MLRRAHGRACAQEESYSQGGQIAQEIMRNLR
jgi:hypothetical protein